MPPFLRSKSRDLWDSRVLLQGPPSPAMPVAHPFEDRSTEMWVKRDDLIGDLYGGNKVRKLEFLLGDAQRRGCRRLLTTGALGSHHVLATTLYGTRLGFEVHAVMLPQPRTPHVDANLARSLEAGVQPCFLDNPSHTLATYRRLRRTLHGKTAEVYAFGPGGSSAVGTLGFVAAAFELEAQVGEGHLPAPSQIVVALGSGGTAVGLALGLAMGSLRARVLGVRVTPGFMVSRVLLKRLALSTARLLTPGPKDAIQLANRALSRLDVRHDFFGGGYGTPTSLGASAAETARRCAGITLDPTYTQKAFAGCLNIARCSDVQAGPILYWHTLSAR